jgi:hypothetical protein
MRNQKKRDSKRTTVISAIACAVGVFIVGASTVGNNVTSMWNSINSNKKGSLTASTGPTTPLTHPSPIQSLQPGRKRTLPAAQVEPKIQVSTGEQSPNLNDVHGSVRLQYDLPGAQQHVQNASSSPKNPSVLVMADSRAAVQVSAGTQSPNISGVDKDVDMRFKSTPSTEGKKD